MTDLEDNFNLGEIVCDDNNQERKRWVCLGQTCSRSLIVFQSQLFVILLIIFGCFWINHLSKTSDEPTVCVGILCSAAGYNLPSPRFWTSQFPQKPSLHFIGWSFRNWKIAAYLQLAKNWNISTKVWQNSLFLSTFTNSERCYAKGNWKSRVCALSKLWIYWFVKKQRYKSSANVWRLLWKDFQLKGLCWHCHCWETSASERNLHWTQPFSPEQTKQRRWATKHSHCSLQVSPWRNASNYL